MNPVEIAEAFSGHQFEDAYEYLADDIIWNNLGGEHYEGKEQVIAACRQSAEYLATVTTVFKIFRSFEGDEHVTVDSLSDYIENDVTTSTVASCDIYEFSGGQVSGITSYNIELERSSAEVAV